MRMPFVFETKLTLLDTDPDPLVPEEVWDYESLDDLTPDCMYQFIPDEEDQEDIKLNLIEVGIGRDSLLSFLKCACGRFPENDYLTCIRGHYICNDCVSKVKPFYRCPHNDDQGSGLCRERIIESKCGIMDDFLDNARIPCVYAGKGCEEMMIGQKHVEHRDICIYRPLYLCLDQNCNADLGKMCETEMLKHLMATHGVKLYNNDKDKDENGYELVPFRFPKQDINYEAMIMDDKADLDYRAVVERQPGLIYTFDESNFLLILERILDEVNFRVLILNKQEGRDYVYQLSIIDNEGLEQKCEEVVSELQGSFSELEESNEGLCLLTQAIEARYLCSTLGLDFDRVHLDDKDKKKDQFIRIKFGIDAMKEKVPETVAESDPEDVEDLN